MTMSQPAIKALNAESSDEVFLILLTLDHPTLSMPVRVVRNNEDIVSRGESYVAFPFDVVLPDAVEGRAPQAKLRIDNVSRMLVETIRSVRGGIQVTLEIIRAAAPDEVELSFSNFTLTEVNYDALMIEGALSLESMVTEPFPAGRFTPSQFPGLF